MSATGQDYGCCTARKLHTGSDATTPAWQPSCSPVTSCLPLLLHLVSLQTLQLGRHSRREQQIWLPQLQTPSDRLLENLW